MTEKSPAVAQHPGLDARQIIKAVVYTLLLINFGLYIAEDMSIAAHTLRNGGGFFDYTAAFAVSIGVLAWLMLLFLFELETYLLSDEAFTPRRVAMMHGLRLMCYVFLAYQVFAYSQAGIDLIGVQAVPGVDTLCQMAGQDISFGFNITYTDLSLETCAGLSSDTQFFLIENGAVVTDTLGLQIERELVWIDLAEAIVWLVIVLCIEIVVRYQDRGITRAWQRTGSTAATTGMPTTRPCGSSGSSPSRATYRSGSGISAAAGPEVGQASGKPWRCRPRPGRCPEGLV